MAWSYGGDPASNNKDAVRWAIQDTVSTSPLLEDSEINFALTQKETVLAASAECCLVLSRRFAAQSDTALGSLKVTYSKQAEVYAERAKELLSYAQGAHALFAGGTSVSDKLARAQNTDRVQPRFTRDQFSRPFGNRNPFLP
jgi:hypothetical protein